MFEKEERTANSSNSAARGVIMDEKRQGSELEQARKRNAELETEIEDLRKRVDEVGIALVAVGFFLALIHSAVKM